MFLRLFLKLEREGMLSDSLYEAGIAQIPMPEKEQQSLRKLTLMNIHVTILNETLAKQICKMFIF